ncbi:MAG: hypothetical protein RRY79_00190 [Clostridia bacterium]
MQLSPIKKIFPITLDIKRSVSIREFEVVDGDTGNVLSIDVTNDGAAIDLTGARVVAIFSKSNGLSIQDSKTAGDGIAINKSSVTIDLFTTSFARGIVECELQIYSDESAILKKLITSAKFNFQCRESMLTGAAISGSNDYPILHGMINEVESAITRANALKDGESAYLYIMYSPTDPRTDPSPTIVSTPNKYIGLATGKVPSAPTQASLYKWYQWRGEGGDHVYVRYCSNPLDIQNPGTLKIEPDEYIGIYVGIKEAAPSAINEYTWYKWKGSDAHIYIRFAATDLSGTPSSTDFSGTPNTYMGIYTGNAALAPTTAQHYIWVKVKGTDGIAAKGDKLHIMYSKNPYDITNPNMSSTPNDYIGLCVNTSEAAPTAINGYTWYKWTAPEQHIYIRFAATDLSGTPSSTDFSGTPNTYMGIYTGNAALAPTTAQHYIWVKVKGTDGIAAKGDKLHIMYSKNPYDITNPNMSSTPNDYIGLCVNTSEAAPTAINGYTWYKWKGENGTIGESSLPAGGTAGDILTVSPDGAKIWAKPPVQLPTGGTTGDILSVSADGAKIWAKPPAELPPGGTVGNVLTLSASGAAWSALASGNITPEITPEEQTITINNTEKYPFNNSLTAVNLSSRISRNYTVETAVTASVGNIGEVLISDKQQTGFKVEFTGSAKSATIKCIIRGGKII